jgi:hypothetical protein
MGEKMNVYRLLVGKPDRKRQLGRLRCRWIDNINMDLSEIGMIYFEEHRLLGCYTVWLL